MNNQVLHLANQGVTINEIHNVYEVQGFAEYVVLPRLSRSPQHNTAASCNVISASGLQPATLIPLPLVTPRPLCGDDGGAEKIIVRADSCMMKEGICSHRRS